MGKKKLNTKKLTLDWCRELSWDADDAERRIPGANRTKDLFGFADVVALTGSDILAIQCTSRHNLSDRARKVCDSGGAAAWVAGGGKIEVWGWDKKEGQHRLEVRYIRETKGKVGQGARLYVGRSSGDLYPHFNKRAGKKTGSQPS